MLPEPVDTTAKFKPKASIALGSIREWLDTITSLIWLESNETIYNGLWFSSERYAMQKLIDSTQMNVTGDVRLKIYKGKTHPHEVQNPKIIDFGRLNSKNKISIN